MPTPPAADNHLPAEGYYRIRDWDRHFENCESKRYKHLSFVPFPNRHDGKRYRRVMRHERASEIFAAWCLMVQVASRCIPRGCLVDRDGAMTASDLSDATGLPQRCYLIAFDILTSTEIAWLEWVGNTCGRPAADLRENLLEQNRTEQNRKELEDAAMLKQKRPKPLADDSSWMNTVREKYKPLGVDVDKESLRAQAWLASNPKGRGRKFTQAFFSNWLSRADKTIPATTGKSYPEYRGDANGSDDHRETRADAERRRRAAGEYPEPPLSVPHL